MHVCCALLSSGLLPQRSPELWAFASALS
uniref:Uncharacterized protein n=1 Tax=Heterorhabditis bacteriophora TaxID=37862 RepID=A0A1I7WHF7_HETBA